MIGEYGHCKMMTRKQAIVMVTSTYHNITDTYPFLDLNNNTLCIMIMIP